MLPTNVGDFFEKTIKKEENGIKIGSFDKYVTGYLSQ